MFTYFRFFQSILKPEKILQLFSSSFEFGKKNYLNSIIQFALSLPFASAQKFEEFSISSIEYTSNAILGNSESTQFCSLIKDFSEFFLLVYSFCGTKSSVNFQKNF